jgi:hypothetical protein
MACGGCIFTDKTYVLAGLQVKKERKLVSGFGGMALEQEESIHAALRETIEELLGLFDIPHIIDVLFVHFLPQRFFQNGPYLLLQYSFEDLEDILKTIRDYNIRSPYYDTFPLNVQDLLFGRKKEKDAEIQCLALLPLEEGMQLDDAFLSDIALLLKN